MTATPLKGQVPIAAADVPVRSASDDIDEGDLVLRVTGIVPAGEFHPFVVRAARRFRLRGWIRHDSAGALIRAIGPESLLVRLVRAVRDNAPASSRIRSLDPERITADLPPAGDGFVALVGEPLEWHPTPGRPAPLADVA